MASGWRWTSHLEPQTFVSTSNKVVIKSLIRIFKSRIKSLFTVFPHFYLTARRSVAPEGSVFSSHHTFVCFLSWTLRGILGDMSGLRCYAAPLFAPPSTGNAIVLSQTTGALLFSSIFFFSHRRFGSGDVWCCYTFVWEWPKEKLWPFKFLQLPNLFQWIYCLWRHLAFDGWPYSANMIQREIFCIILLLA